MTIKVKNMTDYLDVEMNEVLPNGLVALKFYSTTCAPCKMLGMELDKVVASSEVEATLFNVDVETCPEVAGEFEVFTVPTMVFLKDKQEYERTVGFMPKAKIESILSK